eukprot:355417-Chlamydomonas_euryale.AAC.2
MAAMAARKGNVVPNVALREAARTCLTSTPRRGKSSWRGDGRDNCAGRRRRAERRAARAGAHLPGQAAAWTSACLDEHLSGRAPVWTSTCLDEHLSGRAPAWTSTCLDEHLPRRAPVWTSACLDEHLSGRAPVWTSTCLDEHLSGRAPACGCGKSSWRCDSAAGKGAQDVPRPHQSYERTIVPTPSATIC